MLRKNRPACWVTIAIFSAFLFTMAPSIAAENRPRLMVLTDVGADPDDQQSMIRLMLYANEFDLEGLIATGSINPDKPKEKAVNPNLIREIVEAYGKVRNNLLLHAEGYPAAGDLLALIKPGNPDRGWAYVGDGHDTEASRWIIAAATKQDSRPLNISIWGGQTDLAQALWRIRKDRGNEAVKSVIARLRIYDVADQDGIAGQIRQEFAGLFYILGNAPKGKDKRLGVFRGMYLGGDQSLTSKAWITQFIKENHGPLGALYPMKTYTAPNPHATLKEGDTPSWFYFLPNGSSDPAHPEWGGWGGRFVRELEEPSQGPFFRDASDTVDGVTEARASVWRWRPAFQNDFAARMDWCVKPCAQANHSPVIMVNGSIGHQVLRLSAKPGEKVPLEANESVDPDLNSLAFHWWIYPEISKPQPLPAIENANTPIATVRLPSGASAAEYHVILEVTDNGSPALTSYRRILISVP